LRELTDMGRRPRCPFYGFRWPARSSNLLEVGTAECALDLDGHGPCRMETEQRLVDFERCARRSEWKNLIDAGKKYIRFHGAELPGAGVPLELWQHEVMQQK
jgi:hypothetical protein